MRHHTLRPFRIVALICTAGLLFMGGCKSIQYQPLVDLQTAERQIQEDPTNPVYMMDLGIAYYRINRYAEAEIQFLGVEEATTAAEPDARLLFYLGLTQEALGKNSEARAKYAEYAAVPESSPYRKHLQSRFIQATEVYFQNELRGLIANEQRAGEMDSKAVAIFPLKYEGGPERYSSLGRGMASLISVDLGHIPQIRVLERIRIDALLRELDAASAGLTNEAAPQTGRILSAQNVVTGSYNIMEQEAFSVIAALTDASEPGVDPSLFPEQDVLDNIFRIQKDIVLQLIAALGYEPTPVQLELINRRPTQSLEALLAYFRGLEEIYEGRYGSAISSLRGAIKIDPGFQEAISTMEIAEALQVGRDLDGLAPGEIVDLVEFGGDEIFGSGRGRGIGDGMLTQIYGGVTPIGPAGIGLRIIPLGTSSTGLPPPPGLPDDNSGVGGVNR